MRATLFSAAIAAAVLTALPVTAQAPAGKPGSADPTKVAAGSYAIDPGHTQILFAYDHMGFSQNMGVIAMPTGTLALDPAKPEAAKVSVTIPVGNLRTGIPKLDEHLMGAQFFDSVKFPNATFESTGVKVDGTTADITGNLTIKGKTVPVTLDAVFYGAGANPMSKKTTIGFTATTTVKRSAFGMDLAAPIVDDAIQLKIVAAFEKQ